METSLAVVVIVVVLVSVVGAVIAFAGSGRVYDQVGRGGFELERDSGPPQDSPAARAEAAAEIRQLVEAKSARRVARGESPLDVDAEVARLTASGASGGPAPAADAGLRDEVRQLVIARNARREARGEPALDVDAEVERQLRDLTAE